MKRFIIISIVAFIVPIILKAQNKTKYQETLRPRYHFTPPEGWNNDPNGLVYYEGEYHLFYQKYPEAMEWGPMHWGHAISDDLIHWENLPIALYPDSLGYIFSGSAVVDKENTSGFQTGKEKPLVAIFTYHDPKTDLQSQALAFSNDKGRTWTKYNKNPVIPGKKDFRDPKVSWYSPLQIWIMVVANSDQISIFSSKDLKKWKHESDFGKHFGSHEGVWECPDLFLLKAKDSSTEKWILTVNSGGLPSGGLGTQYFIGTFDGHSFKPQDTEVRWLHQGVDEYAGVTWNNIRDRRVFIGWLNNWPPQNGDFPSYKWRGGMTMPIELTLQEARDSVYILKKPIEELSALENTVFYKNKIDLKVKGWSKEFINNELSSSLIEMVIPMDDSEEFKIILSNDLDQHIDIVYNKLKKEFVIDRSFASEDSFRAESEPKHSIEIRDDQDTLKLKIYYDRSVLEIFLNDGEYLISDLVLPTTPYNKISLLSDNINSSIDDFRIAKMNSIWR